MIDLRDRTIWSLIGPKGDAGVRPLKLLLAGFFSQLLMQTSLALSHFH